MEDFAKAPIQGRRQFYVTNIDKGFKSHDFFHENERITINEFNYLLTHHNVSVVSLECNYRSDDCMIAVVDFDDRYNIEDLGLSGGAQQAYSRLKNSQVDDLSLEDGYRLTANKLYCVSAKKR